MRKHEENSKRDILSEQTADHKERKKANRILKPFLLLLFLTASLLSFSFILFDNIKSPAESTRPKLPSAHILHVGDVCEGTAEDGGHFRLSIDEVFICERVSEAKGYFICFKGNVSENDERINISGLEIMPELPEELYSGFSAKFEKELSYIMSEGETLFFKKEESKISGDFSLVFSIDEGFFNFIKNKTPPIGNERAQMILVAPLPTHHIWTHDLHLNTEDIGYLKEYTK